MDRYLPYALVFGCAGEWAAKFEGLKDVKRMPTWYVARNRPQPTRLGTILTDLSPAVARLLVRPGEF